MGQIKYKHIENGKKHYEVTEDYWYYSKRYNRRLFVPAGYKCDGATGLFIPDVNSDAWILHDMLCDTGEWTDGTLVDNWTASTVLSDVLWLDGHKKIAMLWWIGTFCFGGGKARENGLLRVKR